MERIQELKHLPSHLVMAMHYSPEESSPNTFVLETCCICEEEFYSDSELCSHLLEHTEEDEFKERLKELDISIGIKRSASQRAESPEVWEIVSDESDDESSSKKAKMDSFRLVKTPTKAEVSSTPVKKTSPEKFTCATCSATFTDINLFKQHMDIHEKQGSLKCHICNQFFKSKPALRQHLLLHISTKAFECKTCHAKFPDKGQLAAHEATHPSQPASKKAAGPKAPQQQTQRRGSLQGKSNNVSATPHTKNPGSNPRGGGSKRGRRSSAN